MGQRFACELTLPDVGVSVTGEIEASTREQAKWLFMEKLKWTLLRKLGLTEDRVTVSPHRGAAPTPESSDLAFAR